MATKKKTPIKVKKTTKPKTRSKKKNKGGRPSKITPQMVQKLEEAFALDCTINEACFYAGIAKQTYYNWTEADPELLDRLTALRNKPVLIARQSVVTGMQRDPALALKYLERKRK